jgi:hypothetical protein
MPGVAPKLHHGLKAGEKYKFTYKIPGVHRKPREGLALFLMIDYPAGRRDHDVVFSGRPEFGTTTVQSDWLLSIELADPAATCYMDRPVK